MNIRRMGRIAQEIKKVIAYDVSFVLNDPKISNRTSVTDVTVSSDLSYCDIYVSVIGTEWEKKQSLEGLEGAKGFLKKELSEKIMLRQIPELRFHLDESIERGMKMDELISRVIAQDDESRRLRGEDGSSEPDPDQE